MKLGIIAVLCLTMSVCGVSFASAKDADSNLDSAQQLTEAMAQVQNFMTQWESQMGLITTDVPSMPLSQVPKWLQVDSTKEIDSANDMVPSSSFYRFPKEFAVDILASAVGKSREATFGINELKNATELGSIAVGGYKTKQGQWKLTIVGKNASPSDVLTAIFRVVRLNFVMSGVSPSGNDGWTMNSNADSSSKGGSESTGAIKFNLGGKNSAVDDDSTRNGISLQLFNVELNDALQLILPQAGMQCTKKGSVYLIQPAKRGKDKRTAGAK